MEKKKFIEELHFRFAVNIDEEILSRGSQEDIENTLFDLSEARYQDKEKAFGEDKVRFLERMVSLQMIDSRWKEHLLILDNLREGIHWRSYGQRNPVEEYQHESYQAFLDMLDSVRQGILDMIFKVEVRQPPKLKGVFSQLPQNFVHQEYSSLKQAQAKEAPAPKIQHTLPQEKRVGRNDPCPCGSGRKYKKCCGK
jgi:preprotein translocase subunit SecA